MLRAIDAIESLVGIDPARVSIAGASMGGAGATTIGFHHPDRFASITSFFGDSRYDLTTYVRPILRDEAGAHLVNAADVADNVRDVPVWLVHGEDDKVSPIAQSESLRARAGGKKGSRCAFDRAPGFGHRRALVAAVRGRAGRAGAARRGPRRTRRAVTYRASCARDRSRRVRRDGSSARGPGDAYVDVERASDGVVRVRRADNVRLIALAAGRARGAGRTRRSRSRDRRGGAARVGARAWARLGCRTWRRRIGSRSSVRRS